VCVCVCARYLIRYISVWFRSVDRTGNLSVFNYCTLWNIHYCVMIVS